ncbi:MAG: alpha-tubulin suppressor-like RCC1 family protein [Polyangiales bacterium]|jgi:alpha-tubulin suppressor-like RCC1 family protein
MRSTLLGFVLLTLSCGTPVAITSVVVGDDLSCGISGNQILCWGDGESLPSRRIFGTAVMELLVGSETYCALLADTGWSCWGSNAQGQFGVSSPTMTATPVPVAFSGDSLKLARFGGAFSCGTTMGELACWGAADRGQLGPSVTTSSFLATPIILPDMVREFAVGREHACAITATMGVWCWGAGLEGQLGNLNSQDSAVPIRVALDADFETELANVDAAVSISLGELHSCAQAGAQVRCWGGDELGQLGQGVRSSPLGVYAVPVGASSGALQAGANHTCTLSTDGVAQCWGDNDKGQLQSPAQTPMGPLTVGVMPITTLALGKEHSCAFSEAQVLCWGSATQGQLGPATSVDTFVPTVVNGLQ